jgi:hypothetical protein
MSGFSLDWLDLRETADHRARDDGLLLRARDWLVQQGGVDRPCIIDLGSGSGSTLRAFAACADINQWDWRLVDADAGLLAEAARRHGSLQALQGCQQDLAAVDSLPLAGAQMITASALFDLVSADFIDALLQALGRSEQKPALYCALNYDGTTQWSPEHPLDDQVLAAFNRDQQRDKGFGKALGPAATAHLAEQCAQAGYTVELASSHWRLGGRGLMDDEINRNSTAAIGGTEFGGDNGQDGDSLLASALIDGIAAAVVNDEQIDKLALQDWLSFRQAHVASGLCIVGHMDLLALPPED